MSGLRRRSGWLALATSALIYLSSAAEVQGAAEAGKAAPRRPAAASVKESDACIWRRVEATSPGGAVYSQDCADAPQLVTFRGGSFRMGDLLGNGLSYEVPVHEVNVKPFALGRYEVTFAQWQACVAAGSCDALPTEDLPAQHDQLPVAKVTWNQTQQYLGWLSKRTGKIYRLPTEAEWEYAARAGSTDQFTWGNQVDSSCDFANAFDLSGSSGQPQWNWKVDCDDGFAQTAAVGSYPPNAWGLYDMLGNVWEWVQDCWHGDYSGAPTDGSAWMSDGDCGKHVNRGGGWGNHPRSLRVSNRDGDSTDSRSDGLGFRVARDVVPTAK